MAATKKQKVTKKSWQNYYNWTMPSGTEYQLEIGAMECYLYYYTGDQGEWECCESFDSLSAAKEDLEKTMNVILV